MAPDQRAHGLPPSFAFDCGRYMAQDCWASPRSRSEVIRRLNTPLFEVFPLPQGSSLRSGLFCPGPSTLNRPHPPHSPAQRHFAALRFIGVAFAVPAGLGDQRVVPCFRWLFCLGMSSSMTPGTPSAASTQFFAHRRRWPSSLSDRLGVPNAPTIRFKWAPISGLRWFASATTCRVACLSGGSDTTRRGRITHCPLSSRVGAPRRTKPTETFTSGLPAGPSPFLPPDMTTVATGQFPPAGLSPARTAASIAAPMRSRDQ